MSRFSTRPSQATQDSRFRRASSFAIVALLLLFLPSGALRAQTAAGPGTGPTPPVRPSSVDGFVTAVDGNVVTLLGSQLLELDLTGAILVSADADAADTTPPPIAPGAYIAATVEATGAIITIYPPPPLKVIRAVVRPTGTALLTGRSRASDRTASPCFSARSSSTRKPSLRARVPRGRSKACPT